MNDYFNERYKYLQQAHREILEKKNVEKRSINGIYNRF